MAMCIFVGCSSVQKPFSSVTFFNLPKDYRRSVWIKNSGNTQLLTLSDNARRVVCEKHFTPTSLRKQFHRTILCRGAVPEIWCHNPADNPNHDPGDSITYMEGELNTVDDQSINAETLEEWQTGYGDSMINDAECHVHEITVSDSSKQSEADPDTEDVSVEFINDESSLIEEEDSQLLESNSTDNKPHDQLISIFNDDTEPIDSEVQEVEILENNVPSFVECEIIPTKIRKRLLDEESVLTENLTSSVNNISESTACEVVVSSSSVKSNQTQTSSSTSDTEANSEDKYFALSLIGILQRIPPQKRAFAKLNIMRYLTELEYGLETSLK